MNRTESINKLPLPSTFENLLDQAVQQWDAKDASDFLLFVRRLQQRAMFRTGSVPGGNWQALTIEKADRQAFQQADQCQGVYEFFEMLRIAERYYPQHSGHLIWLLSTGLAVTVTVEPLQEVYEHINREGSAARQAAAHIRGAEERLAERIKQEDLRERSSLLTGTWREYLWSLFSNR